MRDAGRAVDALRPVNFQLGFLRHAEGSVLVDVGDTRVLCAVSIEEQLPEFLQGGERGWVTAEYAMLPRATHTRGRRDGSRGQRPGRSVEIQRLVGRALRAVVDREALGPRTLWVDCDVLQADGGTRAAAITGAVVALAAASRQLLDGGQLERFPLRSLAAAVSVGLVDDQALLDLCYAEDSRCEVDLNVVQTADGRFIEVQGTAEGAAFGRERLDELLDLASKGISELCALQRQALESVLPRDWVAS